MVADFLPTVISCTLGTGYIIFHIRKQPEGLVASEGIETSMRFSSNCIAS